MPGPSAEAERLHRHHVSTDHGRLPLGRQLPARQSLAISCGRCHPRCGFERSSRPGAADIVSHNRPRLPAAGEVEAGPDGGGLPLTTRPLGLPGSDLDGDRSGLLAALVSAYVGRTPDGLAAPVDLDVGQQTAVKRFEHRAGRVVSIRFRPP